MSLALAAAVVAAVFLTSMLSGIFGMAGGMILLWLLLLVLPASAAIAAQGLIQMIANGSRAILVRRYIDWRILGTMLAGLACAALALSLLRYTPELVVVTFAVGLLPVLVWIPRSWLALDASRPLHAFVCGALGGGLNLTVGVAGPTVDIFFIRTEMDRRRVIATKAAMQVLSHAAKIAFYADAAFGLTATEWQAVAIGAPVAVLGTYAGGFVLERMTDGGFRRWTRWIVTFIGLAFLLRGMFLLA